MCLCNSRCVRIPMRNKVFTLFYITFKNYKIAKFEIGTNADFVGHLHHICIPQSTFLIHIDVATITSFYQRSSMRAKYMKRTQILIAIYQIWKCCIQFGMNLLECKIKVSFRNHKPILHPHKDYTLPVRGNPTDFKNISTLIYLFPCEGKPIKTVYQDYSLKNVHVHVYFCTVRSACECKKRLLLICIHHFINRIKLTIGTICAFRVLNPRQWSLAKQSSLKIKSDAQKVPKQAKAKRGGEINPQIYNCIQFWQRKVLYMLSKRWSTQVDRRTWLHVHSGTLWSICNQQWHSPSSWNIKEAYTKMYTLFQNYCENFLLEMIWKKNLSFITKCIYLVPVLQ